MKPVQARSVVVRDGLGLASTDVVMNLFLFFVIAFALIATFQKKDPNKQEAAPKTQTVDRTVLSVGERVKVIDLPSSSSPLGDAPPGALIVETEVGGGVFLDGVPLQRAALTEALRLRLANTKRPVVLRANKGLALGDAVDLLDQINAAGPSSVALSTVEKAGAGSPPRTAPSP